MRTRILNFIARWCEKHGRHRTIYDRDGVTPYLERYYLLFKDRPRWFPFNITLHKILLSDLPVLHDHPWPYATLIVKGAYIEHTKYDAYIRDAGHFRIRGAKEYHWLEVPESGEACWTLFFMGKRCREWGFLKDNRWIQYQEYLDWRDSQTPKQLEAHQTHEDELTLIRQIARDSVESATREQRRKQRETNV